MENDVSMTAISSQGTQRTHRDIADDVSFLLTNIYQPPEALLFCFVVSTRPDTDVLVVGRSPEISLEIPVSIKCRMLISARP